MPSGCAWRSSLSRCWSPMRLALREGAHRRRRQQLSAPPLPRSSRHATPFTPSIPLKMMRDFPGLQIRYGAIFSMAMTEKIDRTIFLGDTGATPNTADIAGMVASGITELELTQAEKVKYDDVLALLAALIDGKYAASLWQIFASLPVSAVTPCGFRRSPTQTATRRSRKCFAATASRG